MFYEKGLKGFRFRLHTASAFTFIEIVLVTIILLVMASIAVPNFSGTFRHYKLHNLSKNMAHLMRYAQSRAITKNLYLKMSIKEDDGSYQLLEGEDIDRSFEKLRNRYGRKFHIPKDIDVETTNREIIFFPDGEMGKARVSLCQGETCKWLSTQEQRGQVWVLDYEKEQ